MNAGNNTAQVAIVTGGGGGIGRAAAERFLSEGWSVVVGDLNEERGASLLREIDAGARLAFLPVDVAEEIDVAALVELAMNRYGRLDSMVNNAGVGGAFGPNLRDQHALGVSWYQTCRSSNDRARQRRHDREHGEYCRNLGRRWATGLLRNQVGCCFTDDDHRL